VASAVVDTHVLLWMLGGTLRDRSPDAADSVARALDANAIRVSIGAVVDKMAAIPREKVSDPFDRIRTQ
jgi:PIN domain nuclease of toxin-antitoxin system